MKNALYSLLLSSAVAAALMGQTAGGPHGPQDRVKSMTAKLGLTAEQQSQATSIFSNAQATESSLRASLKTAHQALNDAVKSNNTVGIEQLSTTLGSLTGQLTLAQSKARAAFYQILTPEQRTALDRLESQRPARFRDGARSALRATGQ
ncbi:MAG: Spy/CpxP family protein refolding chaperone [Bryobacteraceae bacterium]